MRIIIKYYQILTSVTSVGELKQDFKFGIEKLYKIKEKTIFTKFWRRPT